MTPHARIVMQREVEALTVLGGAISIVDPVEAGTEEDPRSPITVR